jgi:hypothetical protein
VASKVDLFSIKGGAIILGDCNIVRLDYVGVRVIPRLGLRVIGQLMTRCSYPATARGHVFHNKIVNWIGEEQSHFSLVSFILSTGKYWTIAIMILNSYVLTCVILCKFS